LASTKTKISTILSDDRFAQSERLKIFLHALLFVLGFSLVFIVGWGGSASLLGKLFGDYKNAIARIGGIVVTIFHGFMRIPAHNTPHAEPTRVRV
jgi:cytochrome c biogenesis protein CcdA